MLQCNAQFLSLVAQALSDGGDSDTATEAEEEAVANVVGAVPTAAAGFELLEFQQVKSSQIGYHGARMGLRHLARA